MVNQPGELMKHTSGPWEAERVGSEWLILSHQGRGPGRSRVLAAVDGLNAEANARLIAAAPDLLEALWAVVEWEASEDSGAVNPTPEQASRFMDIMGKAVGACTKATGAQCVYSVTVGKEATP